MLYLFSSNAEVKKNQIIKDSETIAEFLWKQHYRKVDNDDK